MAASRQPEPIINVTPLVDVVLVLLIIFMVIAPALAQNAVDLPKSKTKDDPTTEAEPISVIIDKAGAMQVDGSPTTVDAFVTRVDEARAAGPTRPVILEADASLSYGAVRPLFAALKRHGARDVSLQVIERE
jgi:biopolymer transport protein TolR